MLGAGVDRHALVTGRGDYEPEASRFCVGRQQATARTDDDLLQLAAILDTSCGFRFGYTSGRLPVN